jgi:hypothetical protein
MSWKISELIPSTTKITAPSIREPGGSEKSTPKLLGGPSADGTPHPEHAASKTSNDTDRKYNLDSWSNLMIESHATIDL